MAQVRIAKNVTNLPHALVWIHHSFFSSPNLKKKENERLNMLLPLRFGRWFIAVWLHANLQLKFINNGWKSFVRVPYPWNVEGWYLMAKVNAKVTVWKWGMALCFEQNMNRWGRMCWMICGDRKSNRDYHKDDRCFWEGGGKICVSKLFLSRSHNQARTLFVLLSTLRPL